MEPSETTRYASLRARAVLVTGGGSGIGAALVRAFCEQGARVGFLDIAAAPSESLVRAIAGDGLPPPVFMPCDLRDIDALRQAVAAMKTAIGPISVLVNNAAHDERHDWADVTPAYWDERFAVNLRHQFFAAQAVIDDMKADGGGSIINFTSTSWMVGVGGMAAYTAAKSGVIGLTRSLARDLGPFGIRCNAVAPGWVMTERQVSLWLTPESEKRLLEDQCLKFKLVPEDMAPLTLFLAADDSRAITSQTFVADAGLL
ncbi:SDR family NAD(P)-dependent oxidoreductase [Labrys monachus]|uniref:NAD(P)-dependent dehydrogenase (Short-subunit alcohol dehydrogenase family) n=1 Tax=Labrys monachus TaxID=217067 RepID=A0ABU0FD39_9HYPH|nr:SDR family oxidoreductase [Labrys monachus]MDQ0392069.1 NAD(P)-dependent dehydrogenase (short-subunit alcohol dehydrogenase family) [Labrys monachus]